MHICMQQHCGRCGSKMEMSEAGHSLKCTNSDSCGRLSYPRMVGTLCFKFLRNSPMYMMHILVSCSTLESGNCSFFLIISYSASRCSQPSFMYVENDQLKKKNYVFRLYCRCGRVPVFVLFCNEMYCASGPCSYNARHMWELYTSRSTGE